MLTRAELIASIVIESVSPIGLAVLGVLIAATVIITVIRFLTATAITAILISSVGTILASIATTLIAMLEQIIATLGLGIAHAGAAFRTVAVLLVGLAAVLALRLVIGSELIAGGLVPGLGLDDVLLVTVAIAVTLALAAAAGLAARRVLGTLILALARVADGLRLVETPAVHALGSVAHKLKHFGRIVSDLNHLGFDTGLIQQSARFTTLFWQHQGDHVAGLASAGGTTGAVHERLRVGRRLDLHHKLHAADVNTTGGHVGGHHDAHITGVEGSEIAVALVLAQIAVQFGGRNAVLSQVLGELLGLELGAGKQDTTASTGGQRTYKLMLVTARGFKHMVGHQVRFGGGRIDLVHLGIMQEGVHHFIHAMIERGGEQHMLGVGRNLLKQSLDRRQEAHVGHFVGLVDYHDFDGRKRERFLTQQILKTARAGDHDIGAGLQITHLMDVLDTAVNRGGIHAKCARQRHQHVIDLVGQLTGGGQHESARMGQEIIGAALLKTCLLATLDFIAEFLHRGLAKRIIGSKTSDQRNRKGEGLAGTGTASAENVAPGQRVGQSIGLNGERGLFSVRREHAYQRSGYSKFTKGNGFGFLAVIHREIGGILEIIKIVTGHNGLSCQRLRKLRKLSKPSVRPLLCL